jgi:hypothetical protein
MPAGGYGRSDAWVQAPKGVLKTATVNRYLKQWGLDWHTLRREPPAVRFQAEHSNKLAPCGRTFLVHHMPGAPPTSPSTQSCQRELSHGLFPIPVRSSVWWDTATGTITPSLDLA